MAVIIFKPHLRCRLSYRASFGIANLFPSARLPDCEIVGILSRREDAALCILIRQDS